MSSGNICHTSCSPQWGPGQRWVRPESRWARPYRGPWPASAAEVLPLTGLRRRHPDPYSNWSVLSLKAPGPCPTALRRGGSFPLSRNRFHPPPCRRHYPTEGRKRRILPETPPQTPSCNPPATAGTHPGRPGIFSPKWACTGRISA